MEREMEGMKVGKRDGVMKRRKEGDREVRRE